MWYALRVFCAIVLIHSLLHFYSVAILFPLLTLELRGKLPKAWKGNYKKNLCVSFFEFVHGNYMCLYRIKS